MSVRPRPPAPAASRSCTTGRAAPFFVSRTRGRPRPEPLSLCSRTGATVRWRHPRADPRPRPARTGLFEPDPAQSARTDPGGARQEPAVLTHGYFREVPAAGRDAQRPGPTRRRVLHHRHRGHHLAHRGGDQRPADPARRHQQLPRPHLRPGLHPRRLPGGRAGGHRHHRLAPGQRHLCRPHRPRARPVRLLQLPPHHRLLHRLPGQPGHPVHRGRPGRGDPARRRLPRLHLRRLPHGRGGRDPLPPQRRGRPGETAAPALQAGHQRAHRGRGAVQHARRPGAAGGDRGWPWTRPTP